MNISERKGDVIEVQGGYEVCQHFNRKAGRWYVWLPKHSGLRERFGGRDRMLRSHYVWCISNGVSEIPFGYVIHHKDHNRVNDELGNLQLMTGSDHDAYHASEEGRSVFLRNRFTGRKHSKETIAKMIEHANTRGNNGIWDGAKTGHFQSTKDLMAEKAIGEANSMHRDDLSKEEVRRVYDQVGTLIAAARQLGCSVNAIRNRLKPDTETVWKELPDEELLRLLNECGGSTHALATSLNAPPTSVWRKINRIRGSK